jgi:hypothetical protein
MLHNFFRNILVKTCVLHNFFRIEDGIQFEDTLYECPIESVQSTVPKGNIIGAAVREYYAKYFTFPQVSVPWQHENVQRLYYD